MERRWIFLSLAALGVGCSQPAERVEREPIASTSAALSTGIVISAVYGGGTGATYKSDFVELFNRSANPVSLAGLSLQYSRADYQTWSAFNLSGTIPAGGYFLVKLAANASGTTDLPAHDVEQLPTVNYGTQSGLVALVKGATLLTCGAKTAPDAGPETATPCADASILDFVGYGKTGATPAPAAAYEGAAAAPTGTATGVLRRKNNGCTDTNDNDADFELVPFSATVVPRNTATAPNPCVPTGLVISSVYGGGTGATYKSDFVELFNRSAAPINLAGISLQYSRADYQTWSVFNLTGTVPAGGYFLIKLAANASGTTDLPAHDAEQLPTVNYGTQSGLVALVAGSTAINCGAPAMAEAGPGPECSSPPIIDFVGYGRAGATPAAAAEFEGSGAAPTGTATSVIRRKNNGCTDTNDNANDFELVAFSASVVPRNATTPVSSCATMADAGVDAPADAEETSVMDSAVVVDSATVDSATDSAAPSDTGSAADADAAPDTTTDPDTGSAVDSGVADTGSATDSGAAVDTGLEPLPEEEELTDDGCNCRVVAPRSSEGPAALAFGVAALVLARRRRAWARASSR